ncbi:MAG: hypothetical protein WCW52_09735 [Elusimicrobiales bacterium]
MKKLIPIVLLAAAGLGTAHAEAASPVMDDTVCRETAVRTIETLAVSITVDGDSSVKNAETVAAIVDSCDSPRVRMAAIAACNGGLTAAADEPTISIAKIMEKLCGDDRNCAEFAVSVLDRGISDNAEPTVSVARSIVEIVKQAPYEEVKTAAIASLSKGIAEGNKHPGEEMSAAIEEVENLRR